MVLTFYFLQARVCSQFFVHLCSTCFTLVIKNPKSKKKKNPKSGYLLQTKVAKLFLCILYLSVVEFSMYFIVI